MKIPLFQVDAFTDRVFAGNPAAVCVLDAWPADGLLKSIAAENNLSETAFIVPEAAGWGIRWFTPTVEVDLCGHATLAAAFVIGRFLVPGTERISFASKSGELSVELDTDMLYLLFPARRAQRCPLPDSLVEGLGAYPWEVAKSRDYLAVFDDEKTVRELAPDPAILARLDALGIIVTARAADRETDFVSRFFAPAAGIPEDPVTGSAHCTLVPWWADRLGKDRLKARQVSARGGSLECELVSGPTERVRIGGRAALYLEGRIEV